MAHFTAHTVYCKYLAIKQHFSIHSSYDYLKYNGVFHAKESTFIKRKDSKLFYKLACTYDEKHFPYVFLASFSVYDNPWIGDMIGKNFETIYNEWNNRIDHLEGHFQYQLNRLIQKAKKNGDFHELFRPKDQTFPSIFNYYDDEQISLETLIIADHFIKIFETTNWYNQETIEFTHIPELEYKCKQYKKFLNIESKYGQIIKEQLKQAKGEIV